MDFLTDDELPLRHARIPDDTVVLQTARLSDGRGQLSVLVAEPAVPVPVLAALRRQMDIFSRGVNGWTVIAGLELTTDGFIWAHASDGTTDCYDPRTADQLIHDGCVVVARVLVTMRRSGHRNPSLGKLAKAFGILNGSSWLHVVRPYRDGGAWVYPLAEELRPTPMELHELRLLAAHTVPGLILAVTADGLSLTCGEGYDSRGGPPDVQVQHTQVCAWYNHLIGPRRVSPVTIVTP